MTPASVSGIEAAWRSQPGCSRREQIASGICQKQGAPRRRVLCATSTAVLTKKASSARQTVRTKQYPQSREGETQGARASKRKLAALRSHSETKTEGADDSRKSIRSEGLLLSPSSGSRTRPARWRCRGQRADGEGLAALSGSLDAQAALAFATWVAIASISAGDRQS